jgi:hypothetical protein
MRYAALLLAMLPLFANAAGDDLPYAGSPGALPVQVVVQFLGKVLGENGQFDYRTFKILQDSPAPAFDNVGLTVIREGVNDPVLRGLRHRFNLTRDGSVWTIRSMVVDFSCKTRPAWGTQPCVSP